MSAAFLPQAKNMTTSANEVDFKSVLDGILVTDWKQALVARGFGWHADVGEFSTPITGGGDGTVLDQDQPEFSISVPSGFTLIPIRFDIACQPPLGASDSDEIEILIAVDRAAAQDGTGTATAETPINMRTNVAAGCPATVRSAYTVNATNPTLGMELGHAVKVFETKTDVAVIWTELKLLYEPNNPLFVVGPGCVYGYWGGTVATTGFANLDFLVIPSTLVTALV